MDWRFNNRQAQFAALGFGGLMAFLGLAGLTSGDLFGIAMIAFGLVFGYRGWVASSLVLTHSQVVLRGFVRSHRVALAELARAEVAVGRTGPNGFGRQFVVLTRRDGAIVRFTELNSMPSSQRPTLVESAVASINRALGARSTQDHA